MQAIYGYDVVAELTPGTRYDDVVNALGGAGELVTESADIGPASTEPSRQRSRIW